MKLHYFFPSSSSDLVFKEGEHMVVKDSNLAHQLKKVFRMKGEEKIALLDNSGYEYISQVEKLDTEGGTFLILEKRKNKNIPQRDVHLFIAVPKKDKLEWIVEKGTELGVSRFTPVISARSEKKNLKRDRLEKIIREAAEQSERGRLPVLDDIIPLKEAVSAVSGFTFALDPHGDVIPKDSKGLVPSEVEGSDPQVAQVKIFIGPEGGWSDEELLLFKENNIPVYKLNSPVLKTETAAVVAAAMMLVR